MSGTCACAWPGRAPCADRSRSACRSSASEADTRAVLAGGIRHTAPSSRRKPGSSGLGFQRRLDPGLRRDDEINAMSGTCACAWPGRAPCADRSRSACRSSASARRNRSSPETARCFPLPPGEGAPQGRVRVRAERVIRVSQNPLCGAASMTGNPVNLRVIPAQAGIQCRGASVTAGSRLAPG